MNPENNHKNSPQENYEKEDLKIIKSDLGKILSSVNEEKIFSLNTLTHILLPSLLGAFCAALITCFDIVPNFNNITIKKDDEKQIAAYIFVTTVLSSAITLSIVGLPNREDKRIKTWVTTIAFSLYLPAALDGFKTQTNQEEAIVQATETVKENAENSVIKEIESIDQITKTVGLTISLIEKTDNKQAIEDAIQASTVLIPKLKNSKIINDPLKKEQIKAKYKRLYDILSKEEYLKKDADNINKQLQKIGININN